MRSLPSRLIRFYNLSMRFRVVLGLLLFASLLAADTTKRLILKDGSYQRVQKYEIKGDRVRYLSAERYGWEEIPTSMIDWDATKKYEEDLAKRTEEAQKPPDAEEETRTAAELDTDARTPEVAPNLRLPAKGGVFALDDQFGKPELVEITQNATQNVPHTTKYVLMKKVNPVATRDETIELPRSRAGVRLQSSRPAIFIKPEVEVEESSNKRGKTPIPKLTSGDAYRFELVKIEPKGKSRLVATVKTDIADDKARTQSTVAVTAQVMEGNIWIKLQPKQVLSPGEYAVMQTTPEGQYSSYVWDFGIDSGHSDDKGKKKSKH